MGPHPLVRKGGEAFLFNLQRAVRGIVRKGVLQGAVGTRPALHHSGDFV